jgi:CheY-like chemotaxis protein
MRHCASDLSTGMTRTKAAVRVLLVDDDPDSLEGLALLLQASGCVVQTARDAGSTLTVLESFTPDVVVMDMGLPDLDGCELAQRLRGHAATSRSRLVALTGRAHADDRRRALEAGFASYLVKPVDAVQLLQVIAEE